MNQKNNVEPASRCCEHGTGFLLLLKYQCNPHPSRLPKLSFPNISEKNMSYDLKTKVNISLVIFSHQDDSRNPNQLLLPRHAV